MDTYKKCDHCGAEYGLHRSDTNQCPRNGVEETRYGHLRQWGSTTFLDLESVMVERAAHELLNALKITYAALEKYGYDVQPFGEREFIRLTVESALRSAGKM